MELPMTNNAALAVAATGGAAGAHDPELPEPVITIPEVWRLQLVLPWRITLTDAAAFGAVILLAVTYVLSDIIPQRTWIAQAWLFSKLVLVLIVIYGAFGIICTLWDRLCRARRSLASPPECVRPQELKQELVKRWIDNLSMEKAPEDSKKNEKSDVDPVGDGTPLGAPAIEIKDSKSTIGEVLAHHISLEEKRAHITGIPTDQPHVPQPIDRPTTASVVNVVRTEYWATESGCPGGDVAWSMAAVIESGSQEKCQEVPQSSPCSVPKPVAIPAIKTVHFDSTDVSHSQEGLNFTDESPEDTAGSNTPADEADTKEPAGIVRVFSKTILYDFSKTPPKENSLESLKVDEEWQGAVGPEHHVTSSTMTDPAQEECIDVPQENITTTRPPSQPAGASSVYSVSQAFLLERNVLKDNEYSLVGNMADLQERDSMHSQTSLDHKQHLAIAHGGYPQCPYRYCCRNHLDHDQGMELRDHCFSGSVDLLDESRPMPGSYFGVSRSMCDTDLISKFHLSVIPEDDLPQSV